jgi:hypothetical protein
MKWLFALTAAMQLASIAKANMSYTNYDSVDHNVTVLYEKRVVEDHYDVNTGEYLYTQELDPEYGTDAQVVPSMATYDWIDETTYGFSGNGQETWDVTTYYTYEYVISDTAVEQSNTPPGGTVDSYSWTVSSGGSFDVSGTAWDDDSHADVKVELWIDGTNVDYAYTADPNYNWQITHSVANLSTGQHTFDVIADDGAGGRTEIGLGSFQIQ